MTEAVGVKFIYLYCNDLSAMRNFYSEMENAGVAYDCDGLQFTIFFDRNFNKHSTGWSNQPGWVGGNQPTMSWSVVFEQQEFRKAVTNVLSAGIETFFIEPEWLNYWSFPVRDPMGNTVELVFSPENKTAW